MGRGNFERYDLEITEISAQIHSNASHIRFWFFCFPFALTTFCLVFFLLSFLTASDLRIAVLFQLQLKFSRARFGNFIRATIHAFLTQRQCFSNKLSRNFKRHKCLDPDSSCGLLNCCFARLFRLFWRAGWNNSILFHIHTHRKSLFSPQFRNLHPLLNGWIQTHNIKVENSVQ